MLVSKFCTKCGSALKEQERFCPSCGTEYKTLNEQVTVETVQPKHVVDGAPKEKMTLWKKALLSLAIVVVAVATVGHFTIKSITGPDKAVLPIFNAILDGNEEVLFANLTLQRDVKYDAKAYISHLTNQEMDYFLQTLKNAANDVRDDGITRVVKHEDGSELFRLRGKKSFISIQQLKSFR